MQQNKNDNVNFLQGMGIIRQASKLNYIKYVNRLVKGCATLLYI